MDCFIAFLDAVKPANLAPSQSSLLKPIIDKCIGAAKPHLKAKGIECMLEMFATTDNFDSEVFETLLELCKNKAVKVSEQSSSL